MLLPLFLLALQPLCAEMPMVTCRTWRTMTPGEKIYYLFGTIEGLSKGLTISDTPKGAELMNRYFSYSVELSTEEYSKGLDQLCSDVANVRIPGLDAIEIVTLRVSGASPVAVEAKLALLRKILADYEKKKPPQ